jgi:tetratricopeptide (TPR) repeat protein
MLANLYIKVEDWEQAEHWNQIHYQTLETVKEKVENRCLHGYIQYTGLQKAQQALQAYKEALSLDPACIPAIQQIAPIYIALQDWDTLISTYQTFLQSLPANKQKLGFPFHWHWVTYC